MSTTTTEPTPQPTIPTPTLLAFARGQLSLDQLAQALNLDLLEALQLLEDHHDDLHRLKRALEHEYAAKLQAMANKALGHLAEIADGSSTLPAQARKACTDILRIHSSVLKKTSTNPSGRLHPQALDELIQNTRYKAARQCYADEQLAKIDRFNLALEKIIRAAAKGPVRHLDIPDLRINCRAA